MSFLKFLPKYVSEVASIGQALESILSGVALPFDQRGVVKDTIAKLNDAVESITKSLEDSKPETTVKISKKDIETAVAAQLPAMLNDLITKAVTEALADKVAENATDGDA